MHRVHVPDRRVKVLDHILHRAATEPIGVVAGLAQQGIVPPIRAATVQDVVSGSAKERVVAITTIQSVVACPPVKHIVPVSTKERVVARPAGEEVVAALAAQEVIAPLTEKLVVPAPPNDDVVTIGADQQLIGSDRDRQRKRVCHTEGPAVRGSHSETERADISLVRCARKGIRGPIKAQPRGQRIATCQARAQRERIARVLIREGMRRNLEGEKRAVGRALIGDRVRHRGCMIRSSGEAISQVHGTAVGKL